jgi:hypothetical protein
MQRLSSFSHAFRVAGPGEEVCGAGLKRGGVEKVRFVAMTDRSEEKEADALACGSFSKFIRRNSTPAGMATAFRG